MRLAFLILLLALVVASCSVPSNISSWMAARFYDQGDFSKAIQYYLKAVADGDQREETFFWLGMSFYKHGDLEDARLALERSFEKDSSDVAVIERLASVNLDLGDLSRAAYYSRKAIRLDGEAIGSYNTLGHVLFGLGDLDSAGSCFNYALSLAKRLRRESIGTAAFRYFDDPEAEAMNGLGEICLSREMYYRALDYFGSANSLAQQWETPWFNKGRVYEILGNNRAAEVAYERMTDLAPRNPTAYKNLARLYRRLGRDSESMTMYKRVIRIDSADVDSYYALAELYEKNGDHWNAADTYNKAVDKSPEDPTTYFRAAKANMVIGNNELAIEFLSAVVELQPQRADGHNALGEAYRSAGDTVLACHSFEEAIALDSLYTIPLRNLGALLLQQNKEAEGLKHFVKAARLGDEKAEEFLRSRGLGWK